MILDFLGDFLAGFGKILDFDRLFKLVGLEPLGRKPVVLRGPLPQTHDVLRRARPSIRWDARSWILTADASINRECGNHRGRCR